MNHELLAEMLGVAREKKIEKQILKKRKFDFFFSLSPLSYPQKMSSPFGPAVFPAIGNIYTNVLFHYIEKKLLEKTRVFATYSDFLIFFNYE